MGEVVEVDDLLNVTLMKHKAVLHAEDALITVLYADVPRLSRALSVVKESAQYAEYLKHQGLA